MAIDRKNHGSGGSQAFTTYSCGARSFAPSAPLDLLSASNCFASRIVA